RGECRLRTALTRDGTPLWLERGRIGGGGHLMSAPAGLGGRTVSGAFLAAGKVGAQEVASCREVSPTAGEAAVTLLPGVLLARYLGDSSEAAKRYFTALWLRLRPALTGRAGQEPRIWRT